MVGSIASGSGTSVCTVLGHRSGADKNPLRSFSRRRSGEAVRRKLGEAQSPRQKRRAIIWIRNSPRHHRPHRRGDEPPAASATSGNRITLGHNLRIDGHNAGPGPHVPPARGVEPFSRSPQPSARPRHRAPGRGGVDRTTPRPPSSLATKKPSRRNSRRATPTFTWVMFRVSRFWWPSPTPSRNNGSRSLTWSRACRLTLPPVIRFLPCRAYLIGSSSLRLPWLSALRSLVSTRSACRCRTSARALTSRRTRSSAFASRLAFPNGSAVSMSRKAMRPK